MKRCWFGFGLLLILLGSSIWVTWHMDKTHTPMADTVEEAAQRALSGDWGNALALGQQAQDLWEQGWNISAAFADHEPMEEINGLFSQLKIYGQNRDPLGFAVVCAQLKESLEAMGDAHGFVWWNLL